MFKSLTRIQFFKMFNYFYKCLLLLFGKSGGGDSFSTIGVFNSMGAPKLDATL